MAPLVSAPAKDRDVAQVKRAFMKDSPFSGSTRAKKSERTVQFFSRESNIVNMSKSKSALKGSENKIKITLAGDYDSLNSGRASSPKLLNFSARSKPRYDAIATKIQRVYRGHFGRINYFFRNVGKLADEFQEKYAEMEKELANSEANVVRAQQELQAKERRVEEVRAAAANGSSSDNPQVRAYDESVLALMSAHESTQAARENETASHAQLEIALRVRPHPPFCSTFPTFTFPSTSLVSCPSQASPAHFGP